MRIGFVTGSLTSIGSGKTIALPLSSALASAGHQVFGLQLRRLQKGLVDVGELSVWQMPLWPRLIDSPADMYRSARNRFAGNGNMAQAERQLTPYECIAAKTLQKGWDRLSLDLVYAFHNTCAALLLAQERTVFRLLVINLIGFGIDPSRGGAENTFSLQDLIFRRPSWDLHVTATRFEYEQYCEVYDRLGLDRSKLIHLPHPYDEAVFHPHETGSVIGTRGGADYKMLLFPVNVYPRKNIELAIDVVALLNAKWPVRLIVTGSVWDQAYLEMLQKRAETRGIGDRVHFLQGVPYARLAQLYREATATIFTSHQETFGLGIVESLGSGTPVVGPDWINPCREMLEESYGGWCAEKTAEGFATAVSFIFENPPNPDQIATEAKRNYGNQATASRYLSAVEAILHERRQYATRLWSIDWKGLYRDEGDLL